MKTRKFRLIAMMITLAAVMTGINAEAQRRSERTDQNNKRSQRVERNSNLYERRYEANRNPQKNTYKKSNKKQKWEKNRDYQAERNLKYNRNYQHWDRDDHREYSKRNWDRHFKYDRRYVYVHPKYGHVYKRFHNHPVRVRHYDRDYYFYGGQCFRHYNGVGYVHVDFPRNMILASLPFEYERVWIGPRLYYRYGNMVFERCDLGYRLAPNISIQLSAHF